MSIPSVVHETKVLFGVGQGDKLKRKQYVAFLRLHAPS